MDTEDKNTAGNGHRGKFPRNVQRILVVAPQPFYQDRGTPIALRKVLEAATRRGHEVDLLTFPVGEPVELPGLRIFRVGKWIPFRKVPIGFSLRKAFLDILLVPAVLRRTRKERYACIYALEEAACLSLMLRRWHGLPLIYDMQSSLPEALKGHPVLGLPVFLRLLKRVERWTFRNSARVVCSAGLRGHVISVEPATDVREWHFPGETASPPDGDPGRLRKELGIDPASGVVLYAGNFEPYQGMLRLLETASAVVAAESGSVFVLVGDETPSLLPFSESTARLMKSGSLRVVPRKPKSEIAAFLEMADVVVSPRDDTANVGLKIFEYMAAGKPIVATDTKAHRTVLDEDRALLVPLAPQAMAHAILRLLRDRGLGKRLGDSAREYAMENLSREAFEDGVETLCFSRKR